MVSTSGKAVKKEETKEVLPKTVQPSTDEENVSEETVAVITAALMAYYQKSNPKCEFTVRRIKRL